MSTPPAPRALSSDYDLLLGTNFLRHFQLGLTFHEPCGIQLTAADGRVTLEFAECLGACEGAPCMLVNDECHVNLTEESALRLIETMKP